MIKNRMIDAFNTLCFWLPLFILFYTVFDLFSGVCYCDSGSVNDFVVDDNIRENISANDNYNDNTIHNTVSVLSIRDRIRRRISWYISAKNRGV